MSFRKQKGTTRNVAKFSSRSLDSFAGSERTIPRRGNSYFGFGYQATRGLSVSSTVLNRSLLEPLQLDLDPNFYAIKVQEKEQIRTLNDRFASFINKMLEAKLQMLENGPQPESNMESVFQMYIRTLQSQLKTLTTSEELLKAELQSVYSLVEENTNKFEEELNKRYKAENDFVFVKKDADAGYFSQMKLEAEKSATQQYLDFYKALYAEFELVSSQAEQHSSDLKNTKSEISKIKRQITNLQADITHVKAQCKSVDGQIEEADNRGRETVFGAKQKLRDLETALQKAKTGQKSVIRVLTVPKPSRPEPVTTITCTKVFLIRAQDNIISVKD
ncbi:Keratin, type II cytoskeletal 8 [Bagarius yarrelli]|uniref:Keratin, type II cytoskeletal 8 n=1 Tax=Bagarius yarrelli TaxID=175774 RepID=A0A556VUF3_BAGYA|nr:Keratin, type II cytoskeletal 8 [Bagarius yarrelli]